MDIITLHFSIITIFPHLRLPHLQLTILLLQNINLVICFSYFRNIFPLFWKYLGEEGLFIWSECNVQMMHTLICHEEKVLCFYGDHVRKDVKWVHVYVVTNIAKHKWMVFSHFGIFRCSPNHYFMCQHQHIPQSSWSHFPLDRVDSAKDNTAMIRGCCEILDFFAGKYIKQV